MKEHQDPRCSDRDVGAAGYFGVDQVQLPRWCGCVDRGGSGNGPACGLGEALDRSRAFPTTPLRNPAAPVASRARSPDFLCRCGIAARVRGCPCSTRPGRSQSCAAFITIMSAVGMCMSQSICSLSDVGCSGGLGRREGLSEDGQGGRKMQPSAADKLGIHSLSQEGPAMGFAATVAPPMLLCFVLPGHPCRQQFRVAHPAMLDCVVPQPQL